MNKEFYSLVMQIKRIPEKLLNRENYDSNKKYLAACKEQGAKLLHAVLNNTNYHDFNFVVTARLDGLHLSRVSNSDNNYEVTVEQSPDSPYIIIHNKDYASKLTGRLRKETVFCSTDGASWNSDKNRFLLVHKNWEQMSSGRSKDTYSWNSHTKEDSLSIIDVCFGYRGQPAITLKPNHGSLPWKPKSYRGIDDMMSWDELKTLTGVSVSVRNTSTAAKGIIINVPNRVVEMITDERDLETKANDLGRTIANLAYIKSRFSAPKMYRDFRKQISKNVVFYKSEFDNESREIVSILGSCMGRVVKRVKLDTLYTDIYMPGVKLGAVDAWEKLMRTIINIKQSEEEFREIYHEYNQIILHDAREKLHKDNSIGNFVNNIKRPSKQTALDILKGKGINSLISERLDSKESHWDYGKTLRHYATKYLPEIGIILKKEVN